MKPIAYSLQFRGRATSTDLNKLRFRLTAPSSALVTTIGPEGVQGAFEEVAGGEAMFDAALLLDEAQSTFHEAGTIVFGRGNIVHYRSAEIGRLVGCPDRNLRHGAVVRQVDSGEGQFAGAEGFITSSFLVSDTGEVTDNQLGLIFVHEPRLNVSSKGAP